MNDVPEQWIEQLGSRDASGWLSAFNQSPESAVRDLILDRFYLGSLNLTERGQLLEAWLDRIGDLEGFASRLDGELSTWIQSKWSRYDESAEVLVSAWSFVCGAVEFSARLPLRSRLVRSAGMLRSRFDERQLFLGSLSTGPARDPLGFYLAAIAEFQGDDYSLASVWHRMCDLPDGVPFYHGSYALLGLRRLSTSDPSQNGTLRIEVVLGLLRLAGAFDRLVREARLQEPVAKATFGRIATDAAAAYPDSPRWREHGLSVLERLPDRPQRWVTENIPILRRSPNAHKRQARRQPFKEVRPDPAWGRRAMALKNTARWDAQVVAKAVSLIDEERRYYLLTGDSNDLVRSLTSLSRRAVRSSPNQALRWAEEARTLEPGNPYCWNTLSTLFVRLGRVHEALQFAWVAWRRFRESAVVRNVLGRALTAGTRFNQAEFVFRQTVELFPDNIEARTSLADVLKKQARYEEAETVLRETLARFPDNPYVPTGLAGVLRRSGRLIEAEEVLRASIGSPAATSWTFIALASLLLQKGPQFLDEARELVVRAVVLEPSNRYAVRFGQSLSAKNLDYDALMKQWDQAVEIFQAVPSYIAAATEYPVPLEGATGDEWDLSPQNREIDDGYHSTYANSLVVASLLAEAYFVRSWARAASGNEANVRFTQAESLIARAKSLFPRDPSVQTEEDSLLADKGDLAAARRSVTAKLESCPGSAALWLLKSRLERQSAREVGLGLTDASLAELCIAPQRLASLSPTLAPLFHLERGLAAISLVDGSIRAAIAAESFTRFKRSITSRAEAERRGLEIGAGNTQSPQDTFHGFLVNTLNRLVLPRHSDAPDVVRPEDVDIVDRALGIRSMAIEEIEDSFVDRVSFGLS